MKSRISSAGWAAVLNLGLWVALVASLTGCDSGSTEVRPCPPVTGETVAVAESPTAFPTPAPADVDNSQRVNPDQPGPCEGSPTSPGITLGSDEIAVPDLCISEIPLVSQCLIATGEAEGTVDVWCVFQCEETTVVDVTASWPSSGSVRIELTHPCGVEG